MKRLLIVALLLVGCGDAGASTAGLGGSSAVPAAEKPLPSKVHPTEPPDVVFDLSVKLTKRTASVARNAKASVTIKTTKGSVPIVITCTLGERAGRLDTRFKVK